MLARIRALGGRCRPNSERHPPSGLRAHLFLLRATSRVQPQMYARDGGIQPPTVIPGIIDLHPTASASSQSANTGHRPTAVPPPLSPPDLDPPNSSHTLVHAPARVRPRASKREQNRTVSRTPCRSCGMKRHAPHRHSRRRSRGSTAPLGVRHVAHRAGLCEGLREGFPLEPALKDRGKVRCSAECSSFVRSKFDKTLFHSLTHLHEADCHDAMP